MSLCVTNELRAMLFVVTVEMKNEAKEPMIEKGLQFLVGRDRLLRRIATTATAEEDAVRADGTFACFRFILRFFFFFGCVCALPAQFCVLLECCGREIRRIRRFGTSFLIFAPRAFEDGVFVIGSLSASLKSYALVVAVVVVIVVVISIIADAASLAAFPGVNTDGDECCCCCCCCCTST